MVDRGWNGDEHSDEKPQCSYNGVSNMNPLTTPAPPDRTEGYNSDHLQVFEGQWQDTSNAIAAHYKCVQSHRYYRRLVEDAWRKWLSARTAPVFNCVMPDLGLYKRRQS